MYRHHCWPRAGRLGGGVSRHVGGNCLHRPASGGQFALVTKSGTNQFHGNLNEYHRDPSLVANSWFSNNSYAHFPRNHLIQNQFGGAVGGPITIPQLFNGNEKALLLL